VDLAAADVHVVCDRVGELGRDRPYLAPHAAEVVQQLRPLLGQLGQELGEPEDVYGSIIVNALPPYSAARTEVVRLPGGEAEPDELAVEEPLEIRVNGEPVAVTMRTPGHDEELALGFLLSEGVRPLDASLPDDLAANTVEVRADGFEPEAVRRNFYTSSSCGVCGKGALEAVAVEAPRVESDLHVPAAVVSELPALLREAQPAFAATGGLHATGLFAADGSLLHVREDVGRHNAMDKVIGRAFLDGLLPLADKVLCVSGRLSFELVQKAAVAGCPVVAAVGAPSTLAVELARDRGVTLCGFVRGGRVNVYSEPRRVT
jgi:FdhD protein